MDTPSPSIRALARRLLDLEASRHRGTEAQPHEAVRVHETLRISLTRLAGADGFTALLRRALVLARADVPSPKNVKITADGRIEGLEDFPDEAEDLTEFALALTAHLLGLLETFIGGPLTLRLVRDAWPGAFYDKEAQEN